MNIELKYLNIIKAIYDKLRANIIPIGETLKDFPLRSEILCPLSPVPFDLVWKILTGEIRQEKEIEGIQVRKEKIKLLLFADDIILYLEKPKGFPQNYWN